MKKELTVALLAVGLTIGLASSVTAQSSQQTDVDVEISGVTQLDVRPSNLAYTSSGQGDALAPGDSRITSDGGFEHIEVENIGSERIGTIYAQATMPDEQPFGTYTSDPENDPVHNTGNFVTMSLDLANNGGYGFGDELSSADTMHHLNRVEYFEENPPTYIQTIEPSDSNNFDQTSSEVTSVDVGRFRVGGADYFFVIYGQGTGDDQILIGNSPHTSTVRGTSDFTNTGSDYSTEALSSAPDTSGVFQVTGQDFVSFNTSDGNYTGQTLIDGGNEQISGTELATNISAEFRSYNLYVVPGQDYITRTRFNVQQQSPGYNSSENEGTSNYQFQDESGTGEQEYILQAGTEGEALQPGQNFPINFGVQVPNGVDQTAIEEGTVTVVSDTYNP